MRNLKIITAIFSIVLHSAFAQKIEPVRNWQLLDLNKDGVFGISMERAYVELLKNKTPTRVVVAVIDGGVDTQHEDLRSSIWNNDGEIRGNRKDDDGNGYVDDIQGWNFMGSSKGSFTVDNTEMARQYRLSRQKHPNSEQTRKLKATLDSVLLPQVEILQQIEAQKKSLDALNKAIGKMAPSMQEYRDYIYRSLDEEQTLVWVVRELKKDSDFLNAFENRRQTYIAQTSQWNNPDYNPRAGNKEYLRKGYGNPDSKGPNPFHGTNVAGIIAAERANGLGPNGVADKVKIMSLRAVPNGDYLELDMANAIRYAVDNGAKIINISFNKFNSPGRKLIDEAVKYAMVKDVLVVHASGNKGAISELNKNFPQREYLNGGEAQAWIEVGASGSKDDATLAAWFANFGERVDVFAPGVSIYTTGTENTYGNYSGTSFASPVVAGLAAVIREYYPRLTAIQVKEIIIKSVIKRDVLKNKCSSGGIVNAYEALKLAETY